jgi:propanol-preferring alcohol dehydrogenase
MKAMILRRIVALDENDSPLELVELPTPEPGFGEIRIKVSACGVCHTELDEIEGRTAPPKLPIVLGHQVIGRVEKRGSGANRFELGARVGVGWIHSSTGLADENLSDEFRATGRDAPGGYAEYMTVGEHYAYPIIAP